MLNEPEKLIPACVHCTRPQSVNVPLPALTYIPAGQVVGTVSLSANVPLRSHTVEQIPALHTGVPPLAGQTLLHIPQWLTLVSAVSQPFRLFASQSSQPLLQGGTQ